MSEAYKKAGVNIDAGEQFVKNIKPLIKATFRRGVISEIGGFGGFFALNTSEMREPVLVAGTDGVGTKLRIAIELEKLDTIGIDLVAMCVNDIACCGADPLFFLDYFATSKLDPDAHTAIVKGIAEACKQSRCALIGGETAEMPDMYAKGDFDLAGFAVGIIDRAKIIDGSDVGAGNAIIGIASSGFHSNGYSLVRRIVHDADLKLDKVYEGFEMPLGEALLAPTKLYSPMISTLTRSFNINGIAHITGGGFWDNIPRILPNSVQAVIDKQSWTVPHLFRFFKQHGSIDDHELFRVFNCGIGMVFIVSADKAEEVIQAISSHGEKAWQIGTTRIKPSGENPVIIK
ncbi:MAG: phosphoribosylformylglycinamidine cyclo-ligase [Pseudomonadota bacterium]